MLCLGALLFSIAGFSQHSMVIDRIAVVVGKEVIKTSDIDRDLRVTQFLNRERLDFSVEAKRKAAERLIDQAVIRREIMSGGYRRANDSDADALLRQIRQSRFGGSESRMKEALSRYQLTEETLRERLLWQLTVLRFIDQRFRPGVLVTDEDVRSYYDQHLAELKRQYPRDSSFAALEPKIRELLTGERINQSFVQWLEGARSRVQIKYHQGAFQ